MAAFLAHIRVKYRFFGAKILDLVRLDSDDRAFLYSGSGLGLFCRRKWNCQCMAWDTGRQSFCVQLLGTGKCHGTVQVSAGLCYHQDCHGWYPARLIHAARMNGAAPFRAWLTVQLPLCIPAYCSAAMLIFMDTVGDYGMSSTITAVYSFPTLPYTIYSAICSSPVRFDMAGVLSLYLMVMIIIAMVIQYAAMGKRKYDFLDNGTEQVQARRIGKVKRVYPFWNVTAIQFDCSRNSCGL